MMENAFDECQILCIWTPRFTLVRPLALLFSDVLASFCVFVFCRLIREEWQNFMWKCLEIQKSPKVDRSNSKVDRSNFARSQSIKFCPKSIDRISRTDCCRSAPERPIRSFSKTNSSSPSDFCSRTRWFRDLGCL